MCVKKDQNGGGDMPAPIEKKLALMFLSTRIDEQLFSSIGE